MRSQGLSILIPSLAIMLIAACATREPGGRRAARPDIAYEDPMGGESGVVDCLLPAQVRKLGSSFVYLAPRRTIRTSARECEIRGGTLAAAAIGSPNPSER